MELFEKHLLFLLSLTHIKDKKQRKALVQKMNKIQMSAVRNLIKKFLKSYVTVDDKTVKKMKSHKDKISILAEPVSDKNLQKKKNTLNQEGGFIALLPLLASLVNPKLS